jgi:hypothetical protein
MKLSVLFIILLSVIILESVLTHTCLHGTINEPIKIDNIENHEDDALSQLIKKRFLSSSTWEPIRILNDWTYLESQQGITMGKTGKTITSSLISSLKEVMTTATKYFESILRVQRMKTDLKVTNDSKLQCKDSSGNKFPIEKNIFSGVPYDLVLFPYFGEFTSGGTLAYGSNCAADIDWTTRRRYAGIIQFNPDMFNPTNTNWLEYTASVAIHEITHVLVFNPAYYLNSSGSNTQYVDEYLKQIPKTSFFTEVTVNGVRRNLISSPKVKAAVQKYYNCPTAIGMELENVTSGSNLPTGPHWESRLMKSDNMAPYDFPERHMSEITLALFEDSGWYKTNAYTGGLFQYGKNGGCKFLESKCIENEQATNRVFCSKKDEPMCSSGNIYRSACNLGSGKSGVSKTYQYFSDVTAFGDNAADNCPMISSYTIDTSKTYFYNSCIIGKTNSQNQSFGEVISTSSACFLSSVISKGYESKVNTFCYPYSCDYTTKTITVTIGSTGTNKYSCPTNGGTVEVKTGNLSGTLTCPVFDSLCDSTIPCTSMIDCAAKKSLRYDGTTNSSSQSFTPLPAPSDITTSSSNMKLYVHLIILVCLILI